MNGTNTLSTLLLAATLASGCAVYAANPPSQPSWLTLAQATAGETGAARDEPSEDDSLKMAALHALMSAPPDRALPIVERVLAGNDSREVKARALFVLSQIEHPRARELLLGMARDDGNPLQIEAIRMVGINGDSVALRELAEVYQRGNDEVRQGVLSAYMIAGDPQPVYEIARNATDDEAFAEAVRILGAMGATEQLRQLQRDGGDAGGLIHAFAIAGDLQGLQALTRETDDPEQRAQAIRSIGIVGGEAANAALMDLYRAADDEASRDAAMQGLLISGHDEGVLELFRASDDPDEKRALLRTLMNMGSDLALDVIDWTLDGGSEP